MILRLLRATEWGQLLDFVSPSFFAVLSARDLARASKDLIASTRDDADFRRIARALDRRLTRREVPLRLAPDAQDAEPEGLAHSSRETRVTRGQLVLRLYFEQLLHADAALLDLRGSRFALRDGSLVWSPARGFVRWNPDFLKGIRRMYRGFYAESEKDFRAGLEALNLEPAADLFREHFGEGEQTAVRFEMAHFTRSFHAVFVRCKEHGVRLQPDFVALGVHLASLYEHLEALGEPLDVRAAFLQAAS
jgi:hypothetical protein